MRGMDKILLASLLMGGATVPNAVAEVDRELQYEGEILAEYELIKQKKSRLSRNKREIVESKALKIIARNERQKAKQNPH